MKAGKVGIAMLVCGLLLQNQAYAQDGNFTTLYSNVNPQFFVCIIAGVILAFGFQVIFAALSVAGGVTAVGNIEEMNRNKHVNADEHDYEGKHHKSRKHKKEMSLGEKITAGLGIWTIVTASISLFFASFFAVKLSLIPDNAVGISLGLVIWAAFFMTMTWLELKGVTSFLGGIISTAFSGLKGMFRSVMGKSEEAKMGLAAEKVVGAVHSELANTFGNFDFQRKFDEYIEKLKPREPDYEKIRNELQLMLKDIEVDTRNEITDEGVIQRAFFAVADEQKHMSKSAINKIKDIFSKVRTAASGQGNALSKLEAAVSEFTPASQDDIAKFKENIAAYLKSTNKEEFKPETLTSDLERMMREPMASKEILKSKIKALDRATVLSMISDRTDLGRDEIEKIAGYVDVAVDYVKNKFADVKGNAEMKSDEIRSDWNEASENFSGTGDMTGRKENIIERKIRAYFDSLNREEFNYDRIKRDFQGIIADPSATLEILRNRFREFDRDSLVAVLTSTGYFSEEQIDSLSRKFEDAKMTVVSKAEELEEQARLKLEEGKIVALREAEKVRKTAVAATWWLVASFVISGIASALGGALAYPF